MTLGNQDTDVDRLSSDPKDFGDNYERNMGCLARRVVFAHVVKNHNRINSKLTEIEKEKEKGMKGQLNVHDISNITHNEDSTHLLQETLSNLQKIMTESGES